MSPRSKGETAPATSNAVVSAKPAYLKNATSAMQPAGLPGQIWATAQELAQGFGVPQQMMTDALFKAYQPAATMNFNAPPVAGKVAAKPAPKAVVKPGVVNSPLNLKAPVRTSSLGRNAR